MSVGLHGVEETLGNQSLPQMLLGEEVIALIRPQLRGGRSLRVDVLVAGERLWPALFSRLV